LGFGFTIEVRNHHEERREERRRPLQVVRLTGGLREHLRFFHTVDTAIVRKRDTAGAAIKSDACLRVLAIEPLGTAELLDITTGTGDFIANGVVSHNCYARPTHEALGLSCGLDFETTIIAKPDAPRLLERELASPTWRGEPISMSGVTDPYQPQERDLGITRACLAVMSAHGQPVGIVTKNRLVVRDLDLLAPLARAGAASVAISLTTLDDALARTMEPRASAPRDRLRAMRELADAGIPVTAMIAPVIPGLTDHEMPRLLEAAADAGAGSAGWVLLRLPHQVKAIFLEWLHRELPGRAARVESAIRATRAGALSDPTWGARMRGGGALAAQIARTFEVFARRLGLDRSRAPLSRDAFRRPTLDGQLDLFR
jgi:DNA repair photolyase